jgi:cardiolipin synthase
MRVSSGSIRHPAVRSHSVCGLEALVLRHLPNFICLVRIALIWPTIDSLYSGNYWTALILVAVCAVSDGLDGWLAKRFNWTSHLGKILDPLADKLLLVALFLTSAWINLLPWWLTAIVVARDVMIGFGAVIYRFWFGPLHGRPTLVSKINTGMQLAVALAAILGAATDLPTPEMVTALAVLTLITTVVSGADYLSAFTRRALAT